MRGGEEGREGRGGRVIDVGRTMNGCGGEESLSV